MTVSGKIMKFKMREMAIEELGLETGVKDRDPRNLFWVREAWVCATTGPGGGDWYGSILINLFYTIGLFFPPPGKKNETRVPSCMHPHLTLTVGVSGAPVAGDD